MYDINKYIYYKNRLDYFLAVQLLLNDGERTNLVVLIKENVGYYH